MKDSHEDELEKAAAFFCSQYASNTNANAPVNVAQTIIAGEKAEDRATINIAYDYSPSQGNQDDVYDFSLTSVPNCTPISGFNLETPVPNNQCADLLHSAWHQCESYHPSCNLSVVSLSLLIRRQQSRTWWPDHCRLLGLQCQDQILDLMFQGWFYRSLYL